MVALLPKQSSSKTCSFPKFLLQLFLVAAVCLTISQNVSSTKKNSDDKTQQKNKDSASIAIAEKEERQQHQEQPMNHPNYLERVKYFRDTALQLNPITDKIGGYRGGQHRYHNMYGIFLLPLAAHKPAFKMLEIGLGCYNGRAGASVALWRELFPRAELWEAEHEAACVRRARDAGQLAGVRVLVGDQGNGTVLAGWVQASGGAFDAVVDDGGHANCQISHSFDALWPHVLPGGFYFIEDMHVGQNAMYTSKECESAFMSTRLQSWMAQLIYKTTVNSVKIENKERFPMPKDVSFVLCQAEACVIGKTAPPITDSVPLFTNN